jgi:NADPH:quinone reductase-like Zn-dependent oxidoreductase
MDNHGNAAYPRIKHLLKPGGRFMMVILANLREMLRKDKAVVAVSDDSPTSAENYRRLLELAEQGSLRPVIDSTYPFDQIVDAYRRVDTGHKVGSVVVTVAEAA